MCNGDRPARRDLLFEQRQNRAVGTKHIAEAHRYKFGFAFLRQRLDDHLAQAFCRTHHVGGIHRLVRRDENKTPHTVFVRRKRHIVGAEHVVFDGLLRRVLHQRHMFMRRCMEHHVRLIAREQAVHLFGIAHRGDAYIQLERTAVAALQLLLDGIGAVFINIQNDEPLWPAGRDLAAQLRTDGTAAARHHHDLTGDKGVRQVC